MEGAKGRVGSGRGVVCPPKDGACWVQWARFLEEAVTALLSDASRGHRYRPLLRHPFRGGQWSWQPREGACLRSEVRSLDPGGWERLSAQVAPCPWSGMLAFWWRGKRSRQSYRMTDQGGLAGTRLRAREQSSVGMKPGTLGGQCRKWRV